MRVIPVRALLKTATTYLPLQQYQGFKTLNPAYTFARLERGSCHLFLVCLRQTRSISFRLAALRDRGLAPSIRFAPIPLHLRDCLLPHQSFDLVVSSPQNCCELEGDGFYCAN